VIGSSIGRRKGPPRGSPLKRGTGKKGAVEKNSSEKEGRIRQKDLLAEVAQGGNPEEKRDDSIKLPPSCKRKHSA